MPTAKNAKIEFETSQVLNAFAAMTDSGDHKVFTITGGTVWSGKSGKTPDVRPNGIVSGRNLLSAGATNDVVKVAAFTAFSQATEQSVNATSATALRPTSAGYYKVNSITMASDGSVAVVDGTEGVASSEVRDAAGGPPYIPLDSVEIGQVRVSSGTAALLVAAEMYQDVPTHAERWDTPSLNEKNIGDGEAADAAAEKNAHIKFVSALALSHTAGVPKRTYVKYYAPTLTEVERALDFVPADESHAVGSEEYYRGSIAAVTSTIGQGTFRALLNDGLTDSLIANKNQVLTVKFYPDENKAPYALTQGKIGITRQNPFGAQIAADVTISSESITAEFSS